MDSNPEMVLTPEQIKALAGINAVQMVLTDVGLNRFGSALAAALNQAYALVVGPENDREGVVYTVPPAVGQRVHELYAEALETRTPGAGVEYLRKRNSEMRATAEDRVFAYTPFARHWAQVGKSRPEFAHFVDGKNAFWVDDTPIAAAFLAECRAYRAFLEATAVK